MEPHKEFFVNWNNNLSRYLNNVKVSMVVKAQVVWPICCLMITYK